MHKQYDSNNIYLIGRNLIHLKNIVYLADDHAIVAQGVAQLLQSLSFVEEVVVFNSGKALYEAAILKKPTLIILDIEMPEWTGIDTLKKIKENINVPCIMLSMNDEKYIIQECMKLGASGFMPKDCTIEELHEALDVVLDGGTYLGEKIIKILATKKTDDNNVFELTSDITKREQEILENLCDGHTCKEIADKLFLSARTVETHKKSIMAKFDAHTTGKLISLAIKYKFVK
jgi:DNA-binding NarL/FixJ family response regulator